VDGLGTSQPHDDNFYRQRGKQVAQEGYVRVSQQYLAPQLEEQQPALRGGC
jgi:hypothetical protein